MHHLPIHVIPRHIGDVETPGGDGVRGVTQTKSFITSRLTGKPG
jgi:hypothetical protein